MPSAESPAKSEPALDVRGLERRFRVGVFLRRRAALRGIDLSLARGSWLGLVGPNGSGKTSLLRILAGVDVASAGEVRVLGGDPSRRQTRARVAFLPEDSPFPPELSARAALDLLGGLHGLERGVLRERARSLLERVGLQGEERLALGKYSRGMLRRFGLAQAFLTDPDLVLLDEPTAGLDALGFEVIETLFAEARACGRTLVVASHLASDLQRHCDRVAVLLAGRVAMVGATAEVLARGGRTTLEVEGLDAAQIAQLEAWIREQGGELRSRGKGWLELHELYLRLATQQTDGRSA
jgi:ABC-2 type transport system ATP-binding protein